MTADRPLPGHPLPPPAHDPVGRPLPRPVTTGCCRQTLGCPAHAAGDCTFTPPRLELIADPAVEQLLDALAGPDWRDRLAAHAAAAAGPVTAP